MPPPSPLRLAIVGSGPSAFYAAARVLASAGPEASVHMLERLPSPYGLVRYGVAPDHPEVKNVEHKFASVASDERFRFYGNVNVVASVTPSPPPWSDEQGYTYAEAVPLPLSQLRRHYSHVLLAYGSSLAKPLGVPGSEPGRLANVFDALHFVNWYNGHPSAHDERLLSTQPWRRVDLRGRRHVSVVGAGNVALDVARMLLRGGGDATLQGSAPRGGQKDRGPLAGTDTPAGVLRELASADGPRRVDVFARRGAAQAAFTNKELREMMSLPGVVFEDLPRPTLDEAREHVARLESRAKQDASVAGEARVRRRLLGLLEKGSAERPKAGARQKEWALRFHRAPLELLGPAGGTATTTAQGEGGGGGVPGAPPSIRGARWGVTEVRADGSARPTGAAEETSTDMLVSSVGYRGAPLAGDPAASGLPWDERRGVVPNVQGRVVESEGRTLPGMYVSGWLARGPVGVIASTMFDANSVGDAILDDWRRGVTTGGATEAAAEAVAELATTGSGSGGRGGAAVVSWREWLRLDAREVDEGQRLGKPREKVLHVRDMLRIAKAGEGPETGAEQHQQ